MSQSKPHLSQGFQHPNQQGDTHLSEYVIRWIVPDNAVPEILYNIVLVVIQERIPTVYQNGTSLRQPISVAVVVTTTRREGRPRINATMMPFVL